MIEFSCTGHLTLSLRRKPESFSIFMSFSLERMAKIIEKGKGRIKGGAGYNPFRIKESLEEIERAVKDYGFIYVWAHPITFGLAPNDKKVLRASGGY